MIRRIAREERRSVTTALGLALAAILFAQVILPGALHLARAIPAGPAAERPASP